MPASAKRVSSQPAKEHGFLEPLIDLPFAITGWLSHARFAAVEHLERLFHGPAHFALRRDRVAHFPGLFDVGDEAVCHNGSGTGARGESARFQVRRVC